MLVLTTMVFRSCVDEVQNCCNYRMINTRCILLLMLFQCEYFRDYVYNGDDVYDIGGSNDSMEFSTHGGSGGNIGTNGNSGGKGGREVSVGDYHSANKEYKEVSVIV